LKRIAVTPTRPEQFIGAQVLTRLVIGVMQATLILVVGAALGASLDSGPTLIWLIPLSALGTLLGLSIGFAIAGPTKTPEGTASFASLLVMPLWILSGVMFPLGSLPRIVENAVEYLPATPLVEATRGIALQGSQLSEFGSELAVIGGWLLVSFLVAARSFRFTGTK
jgi:ABC-2 type transport system permease protein